MIKFPSSKDNLSHQEILNSLRELYGEAFYVFDIEQLRKNYSSLFTSFKSRYDKITVGYSYKTNYVPALIKELSSLGAYAEVVSRLEYDLALKIGVNSEDIIFNGPFKKYEDIALALDGNSIINLDSFYEIGKVKRYLNENPQSQVKVGLRVSFDLTVDGDNPLQNKYEQSRFGFCVENGSFENAISELQSEPNIKIVGLHGHFSTSTRSVNVYRKITQKLCDLAKMYVADTLEYIDVGGGFYGNVPKSISTQDVPSFDDYANAICSIMNKEKVHFTEDPLLIIEPGLALVVDTFKFYCVVMDVKKNQNDYFVLVKGSVHNIKPTMHTKNMPMAHVKKSTGIYQHEKFNVVGYTCMEKDYLAIDHAGDLPVPGDFLIFNNVGAYTIVFDPPFIKERPPIIVQDGKKFELARKREKLNDIINDELYVF
ncbi:diaminopimelate decarboxylase [Sporosarcina sp. 6E9]|uniref:diaminopimelate decarboxylase n=1 Tax=Sporosarcina sp. 6E9 TaxID=2819235 RepID=UPI0034CDC9F2